MKEQVYVEFVTHTSNLDELFEKLDKHNHEMIEKRSWPMSGYDPVTFVGCKMDAQYATIIKMSDPFLAERMRISYISDELKDRYRK